MTPEQRAANRSHLRAGMLWGAMLGATSSTTIQLVFDGRWALALIPGIPAAVLFVGALLLALPDDFQ